MLFVMVSCVLACAAVTAADPPGMAVRIGKGRYRLRGIDLTVPAAIELAIDPPDRVFVTGEEHVLDDRTPETWNILAGGTTLNATVSVDGSSRLPYALAPESVKISGTGRSASTYRPGADYYVDELWGGLARLADGAIPPGMHVTVDYEVYLQRIDIVQADPDGWVSVKKGRAAAVCPQIPNPDEGHSALAGVYVPYRAGRITESNVFPASAEGDSWRSLIRVARGPCVQRTRDLLRMERPVRIVCWGDSVTEHYSASSLEKCFAGLLGVRLRDRYQHSSVEVVNAGIAGTNTNLRMDGFQQEVLAQDPDLIIVEFLNDAFIAEAIPGNWSRFMALARAHNPDVEFIILTPSYVMEDWMGGLPSAVETMREVARVHGAALGDVSHIWENLRSVGIPYLSLLANGINHPGDLGHEFFAETIMALLG